MGKAMLAKQLRCTKEVALFSGDGGLQKDLLPLDSTVPESDTKPLQWLSPPPQSTTVVPGNFTFAISKSGWSCGLLQLDAYVRALSVSTSLQKK